MLLDNTIYKCQDDKLILENKLYFLDFKGHGKEITTEDILHLDYTKGYLWANLNHEIEGTDKIFEVLNLDSLTIAVLTENNTRPRSVIFDDYILSILRGINMTPGAEPEDMVSVRVYFDKNKIVTIRRRKLLSLRDIKESIALNTAPRSPQELYLQLNANLIDRIDDSIEDIDENLDNLETLVSSNQIFDCRGKIADLRRQAIVLKRYLYPQRQALRKIFLEEIPLFTRHNNIYLNELIDKLQNSIENLDSFKDRATVIHEELYNTINEEMNNKLYFLSLITIIFLPITFFTGLFGVNLGIPGEGSRLGFYIFCGFLIFVVILTLTLLTKHKWLR